MSIEPTLSQWLLWQSKIKLWWGSEEASLVSEVMWLPLMPRLVSKLGKLTLYPHLGSPITTAGKVMTGSMVEHRSGLLAHLTRI